MKGKVAATGGNHYRPSDQVWCEVEVPDDVDYNPSAMARAPFLKEKGREREKNRREEQLDYIPHGGSYFYRTNSNADERQDWIISGAVRIVRELTREEINRFNRENGFAPDAPVADDKAQAAAKCDAEPTDALWMSRELEGGLDRRRRKRYRGRRSRKPDKGRSRKGKKGHSQWTAQTQAIRPRGPPQIHRRGRAQRRTHPRRGNRRRKTRRGYANR